MEKREKEKKKLGLSTKIFIALLTGAVCGVLIHYYMPEGYFRDTILINGILYGTGQRFYPPDADAGGSSGILLPGLRRHGHR